MTAHTDRDIGNTDDLFIAGGSTNQFSLCVNQCDSSYGRWGWIYLKIQLYDSWAFIQRTLFSNSETLSHPIILLLYSYQQEIKNNLE